MNITGAIYGYATKSKVAFGIHVKFGKFEHIKIVELKSGTTNSAELAALEYAIKCIKQPQTYNIVLDTCNAYIPKTLHVDDNGHYTMTPEKNKELVETIRSLSGPWLAVQVNKSDVLINLQKLVKQA